MESEAQALRIQIESARDSALAKKLSAEGKLGEMTTIVANEVDPETQALQSARESCNQQLQATS